LLISKRLAKEVPLIPNSRTAQKIIGSTHSKKEGQTLQNNGGQALDLLTIALKPDSNKPIYQEIL